MAHAVTITIHQKRKAAHRLCLLGFAAAEYTPLDKLVTMIAKAIGMPLPANMAERNLMIIAFSQRHAKILHDLEPRPFVPLTLSKQMLEAIERAHAWHAPLSLVERLAMEGKR